MSLTNIQASFTSLAATVLSYGVYTLKGIGKLIMDLIQVRQSKETMAEPNVPAPVTRDTQFKNSLQSVSGDNSAAPLASQVAGQVETEEEITLELVLQTIVSMNTCHTMIQKFLKKSLTVSNSENKKDIEITIKLYQEKAEELLQKLNTLLEKRIQNVEEKIQKMPLDGDIEETINEFGLEFYELSRIETKLDDNDKHKEAISKLTKIIEEKIKKLESTIKVVSELDNEGSDVIKYIEARLEEKGMNLEGINLVLKELFYEYWYRPTSTKFDYLQKMAAASEKLDLLEELKDKIKELPSFV